MLARPLLPDGSAIRSFASVSSDICGGIAGAASRRDDSHEIFQREGCVRATASIFRPAAPAASEPPSGMYFQEMTEGSIPNEALFRFAIYFRNNVVD